MLFRINNPWIVTSIGCLLPLFWLLFDISTNQLGSNPIQAIHIRLGDWSLRFLCITLAITPIQTMTKWRGMTDYRQMFGLYAFFYATLHVLGYLFVDNAGLWRVIGIDILESAYIWFGVMAYIILFLLAITSPKLAKKKLGKNWKKLHRLIYYSAGAAMIHYFWQLKGNLFQPLFYLTIIAFLLGFRILVWLKNRQLSKLMLPKGRLTSFGDNQ
ncbi:sulfoxide reductase heme-binding subunit YedZ [Methylomonas sp. LL1]|uniref:sulfite oxidase heme-binding subunit YedZ n=1 Tax=Methylomonas sp. LL1 TaxID=2785785 RepID=UPI0018C37409|nr:protein-methionine-sulfoxide reductase heme-binding subunit MsrQ [Methylomonas sp. LL1]QPK64417.1 sulfoxide reductase heme-binding subunit YedZ [Methylomonas sp. LL1]CAG1020286.1 Protein-methionine-sulfoxide reductase heme-binding subunit MsrQ [Methylococcales bacterium]